MSERITQFAMSAAVSFTSGNQAPGAGAQAFAGFGPNGQPIAMAAAGNGVPGQGAGAVAGAGQNGQANRNCGCNKGQGPQGPQGPKGKMAQLMQFMKGLQMGQMLSKLLQGGQPGGQFGQPGGGHVGCCGNPGFGGVATGNGNNAFAAAGIGGAQPFGNMLGGFLG